MKLRAVLVAVALLCVAAPSSFAVAPPPNADWKQVYFDSADGKARLHADVFRPKGIPANRRTPVLLSIGPYFNHSGQVGALGPIQGAPYDPVSGGPSDRFYDFIIGAKVLERGYTWVQVDLRGFGGSSGCLDWAGPGEQADVKAAVEWAANQSWSTGKVGMYGKSYDGVTGMLGIVQQPKGLAAVIAQEPVYDMYRYLFQNRVRYINSALTPNLYNGIAGTPGTASDTLAYNQSSLNDLQRPGCPAFNFTDQQDPNPESAYWQQRDLITLARGRKTPFFLTQGFIENNTKPDGAFDFYNGMKGPKRAWLGQWDHVRGNDKDENGRLLMGRRSWFEESIRFFDRYVAGKSSAQAPVHKDPPVATEGGDGVWRSEAAWPPPDSNKAATRLRPGSYVDDATNNGTAEGGPPNGRGIWTFSPALDHTVHFAGVPRLTVDVSVPGPNANLAAAVYDVDPQGNALLISRGTYLLPGSGKVAFDLYGNDWPLRRGHRIGVLLSSSHSEWWAHVPTGQTVTVKSASVAMPYLSCARGAQIQGDRSVKLEDYRESAPFPVDAETIAGATHRGFPVPAPLRRCSARELAGQARPRCVDRRKFSFRIHQPKRGRIVRATAYVNGRKRKVVRARGRGKVRRITIRRLPRKTFRVKIVALHHNGRRTISVRKYRGCRKGRPKTRVRGPRRGR
jgi:hypothetical protein